MQFDKIIARQTSGVGGGNELSVGGKQDMKMFC